MLELNGYSFSIEPCRNTIKISSPTGTEYTFASTENLGNIIGIRAKGKKLLIVRQLGTEEFQTALDPSRFRLSVTMRTPRKIINLRQVDYLLKRRSGK
jgi:hypothetical protein